MVSLGVSLPARGHGPTSSPSVVNDGPPSQACRAVDPCPASAPPQAETATSDPTSYQLSRILAWSEVAPPPSGFGSAGGLIANASSAMAVAFGGENSGVLDNSTFLYSEATNSWSTGSSTGAPTPRSDFAFAFDPTTGVAVLFGGLTSLTTLNVSNGTWTYAVGSGHWSPAGAGPAPPARQDAAFAIDPTLGVGLLYGGWNRNYSMSGSLTYSDLWEIDLATDTWTQLHVPGPAPPPLEGASMVWDPETQLFEMFGGCYPCSSAVWEFDPAAPGWTELATPSNAPAARAEASWTYDPSLNADLLFGGTNGLVSFNDTQVFYPGNDTWVSEALPPAPAARSGAASAFLGVPDNETWLLAGGESGATTYSDLWRLSATSNVSLQVVNASSPLSPLSGARVNLSARSVGSTDSDGYLNLTQANVVGTRFEVIDGPWFFSANQTVWFVPGLPASFTVELRPEPLGTVYVAADSSLGPPVSATFLNLSIDGVRINPTPAITNATGNASFHGVPPGSANVTGLALDWRPTSGRGVLSPGGNLTLSLVMFSDPVLEVYVSGRVPGVGTVQLSDAQVFLNNSSIGFTDDHGFFSGPTSLFGPETVAAADTGFEPASAQVSIPYTGPIEVILILGSAPFGLLTVTVVSSNASAPIENATVTAFTPVPLRFGTFATHNETDQAGAAVFFLPVGNYSIDAAAIDFYPSPTVRENISSGLNPPLRFVLTPVPPSAVLFIVRDQRTGAPIANATVTSLGHFQGHTDANGVWNDTAVPPGEYPVDFSAVGYLPNATLVTVAPDHNQSVEVNLTEAPAVQGPAAWAFNLFPGGLGDLWPFLLFPLLLVSGSFVLGSVLRGMREEAPAPETTAPLGPDSSEEIDRTESAAGRYAAFPRDRP